MEKQVVLDIKWLHACMCHFLFTSIILPIILAYFQVTRMFCGYAKNKIKASPKPRGMYRSILYTSFFLKCLHLLFVIHFPHLFSVKEGNQTKPAWVLTHHNILLRVKLLILWFLCVWQASMASEDFLKADFGFCLCLTFNCKKKSRVWLAISLITIAKKVHNHAFKLQRMRIIYQGKFTKKFTLYSVKNLRCQHNPYKDNSAPLYTHTSLSLAAEVSTIYSVS